MLRLVRSFRFAFEGFAHLLRTQPNFRIELVLGALAVGLAAWLGLTPNEWAALTVAIALVLIVEGLNTSLELAIDLASPTLHPKARAAKDIAAGVVVIAAVASIVVGVALFFPRLFGP